MIQTAHFLLHCERLVSLVQRSSKTIVYCSVAATQLEVQQRGIQGCQEIIKGILDGVASDGANKKIFVVDTLPNRCEKYFCCLREL